MLEKALILAAKAHTGQVDKGGAPYILHPIRVMLACEGEKEKIGVKANFPQLGGI